MIYNWSAIFYGSSERCVWKLSWIHTILAWKVQIQTWAFCEPTHAVNPYNSHSQVITRTHSALLNLLLLQATLAIAPFPLGKIETCMEVLNRAQHPALNVLILLLQIGLRNPSTYNDSASTEIGVVVLAAVEHPETVNHLQSSQVWSTIYVGGNYVHRWPAGRGE